MRIRSVLVLLVCLVLAPAAAHADSILFSGTGTGVDGITLNASATFEINQATQVMRISLKNTGDTSGSLKDKSANTLTGLFFDLPSGITLTPVNAKVGYGDIIQGNKCDIGPCDVSQTNVGGEHMYKFHNSPLSGHLGNHGIANSGYIDASSGGSNFNGPDLDAPNSPDGINFGIIAPITASNPFKPGTGNMADNPLIEGEVVFTMLISGGALLESQISNVSFQYGTDIKEPKFMSTIRVHTIPEPAMLLLLVPASLVAIRRRWSRSRALSRETC